MKRTARSFSFASLKKTASSHSTVAVGRPEASAICTDADCWPHANSNVIESRKMGAWTIFHLFISRLSLNTNKNYVFHPFGEFFFFLSFLFSCNVLLKTSLQRRGSILNIILLASVRIEKLQVAFYDLNVKHNNPKSGYLVKFMSKISFQFDSLGEFVTAWKNWLALATMYRKMLLIILIPSYNRICVTNLCLSLFLWYNRIIFTEVIIRK